MKLLKNLVLVLVFGIITYIAMEVRPSIAAKFKLKNHGFPENLYHARATLEELSVEGVLPEFFWFKKLATLELKGPYDGLPADLPETLKTLTLQNTHTTTLANIRHLKLVELHLIGNSGLTDLSPLAEMTTLRRLTIQNNGTITHFPVLPHLTHLELVGTTVDGGFPPFQKFTALESLSLDARLLSPDLSNLPITHLTLKNTTLKSLPKLPSLTELVILRNPQLSNIGLLPALKKLTTRYNDISPDDLPDLPRLESLSFHTYGNLVDLSWLAPKYPDLKRLELFGVDITNLLGLNQLEKLEELQLTDVEKLDSFADLQNPALVKMVIDGSAEWPPEAFAALGTLPLKHLTLEDTRIANSFEGLNRLEELVLIDNLDLAEVTHWVGDFQPGVLVLSGNRKLAPPALSQLVKANYTLQWQGPPPKAWLGRLDISGNVTLHFENGIGLEFLKKLDASNDCLADTAPLRLATQLETLILTNAQVDRFSEEEDLAVSFLDLRGTQFMEQNRIELPNNLIKLSIKRTTE